MKLILCHIENFGKISNLTINFNDGVNIICEDNGWGKSTLASFILTMFYGFANESKRDEFENERKRFKPWQGGVYGGRITFEAEGNQYVISRVFGAKTSDDTLEIRDASTNLPIQLFEGQPGEMFFGIDRKSFCRTAFINQNDCVTETTDGINAKLGNLIHNTDDINNFENVSVRLADMLNSMSPRRATGALSKLKNEITGLENEIRQGEGINSSIAELEKKLQEASVRADELKNEQEELQRKRSLLTVYTDVKAKLDKYESLEKDAELRKSNLDSVKACFPLAVPKKEQVASAIESCQAYNKLSAECRGGALNEIEEGMLADYGRLFTDVVPDKELINEYVEKINRLRSYRHELDELRPDKEELERLAELSGVFENGIPDEMAFRDVNDSLRIKEERRNSLNAKQTRLEMFKSEPEPKKSDNSMILIIVGIVLLVAGIAGFMVNPIAGTIGCLLGLVIAAFGFVVRGKANKEYELQIKASEDTLRNIEEGIEEDKKAIAACKNRVRSFLELYHKEYNEHDAHIALYDLKKDVEAYKLLKVKMNNEDAAEYESRVQRLSAEINAFIGRYGEAVSETPENSEGSLYSIERKAETYSSLSDKKSKFIRLNKECSEYRERLGEFYDYTGIAANDEALLEQLIEIQGNVQKYAEAEREYSVAAQALDSFVKENDVEKIKACEIPEDTMSLEEIDGRINELIEEADSIKRIIADYRRQVDVYAEKKDDLTEKENRLEQLKEGFEEGRKKYELLKLTKEYLEKSKTSFTAKYMEPIMKGYRKYYGMISGSKADNYYIDADTKLTVEEQGLQRETRFLSTGYKDLIGICMRMALIEAMYEGEKPFVVFDDPFVNLDVAKTEKGKEFLKNISSEYQVIYFTCHKDRT